MTTAYERNFNTYILGDNPAELANGLLPEIAAASGYELEMPVPSEENLQGFVGHIGPAKWLQDNIDSVREKLGTNGDAVAIAADWADRSGVLLPVQRSFSTPEIALPSKIDTAFITGGVARWMFRRTYSLVEQVEQGQQIGRVFLPVGTRSMKESEHESVAQLTAEQDNAPTEQDFAEKVLSKILKNAGLRVEIQKIDTDFGDDIMRQFAANEELLSGNVLAIGNAPSAIQAAGQFRLAAREHDNSFDSAGDQLYVLGDTIPVARQGEGPATHQNPFTALGQIARNALFLHRNAQETG